MKNIALILLLFLGYAASAQVEEDWPVEMPEEPDTNEVYEFYQLEKRAEFPGGDDELMKYIARNFKYPELAKDSGVQGTMFVEFVVEKDGSITNVKLLKTLCCGLNKEALRVIKSMPKWEPAMQRDKPVRMKFRIPIRAKLY